MEPAVLTLPYISIFDCGYIYHFLHYHFFYLFGRLFVDLDCLDNGIFHVWCRPEVKKKAFRRMSSTQFVYYVKQNISKENGKAIYLVDY